MSKTFDKLGYVIRMMVYSALIFFLCSILSLFFIHSKSTVAYTDTIFVTFQHNTHTKVQGLKIRTGNEANASVFANLFQGFLTDQQSNTSSFLNDDSVNVENEIVGDTSIIKLQVSSASDKLTRESATRIRTKLIQQFNKKYHTHAKLVNKSAITGRKTVPFSKVGFIMKFVVGGVLIGFLIGFFRIIVTDRIILDVES